MVDAESPWAGAGDSRLLSCCFYRKKRGSSNWGVGTYGLPEIDAIGIEVVHLRDLVSRLYCDVGCLSG
jgi:hypothetical protein